MDGQDTFINNISTPTYNDILIFGEYCNLIIRKEHNAAHIYKPLIEAYARLQHANIHKLYQQTPRLAQQFIIHWNLANNAHVIPAQSKKILQIMCYSITNIRPK